MPQAAERRKIIENPYFQEDILRERSERNLELFLSATEQVEKRTVSTSVLNFRQTKLRGNSHT